ncbi:uncharacterized protein ACIB01_009381 [Guaruba guarouba]
MAVRGRGARGTFQGPWDRVAEEEPGHAGMSPWTSHFATSDAGGQHDFGGADGKGKCCSSRPGSGVWQRAGGGKPWCEEQRMWQRVGRRRWRQEEKGSRKREQQRCQHAGQPWPSRSCQPCALSRSLQLPPGHGAGVPVLPPVCTPVPKDWGCSSGSCSEGPAHTCCPWISPAGTAPVLMAGSRGCQPPAFHSSQPRSWKWVCGPRTDAGAFPGAVGCTPYWGRVSVWHPSLQGDTTCHAHPLRLLRPRLLVLCVPGSGPCPVPHHQPTPPGLLMHPHHQLPSPNPGATAQPRAPSPGTGQRLGTHLPDAAVAIGLYLLTSGRRRLPVPIPIPVPFSGLADVPVVWSKRRARAAIKTLSSRSRLCASLGSDTGGGGEHYTGRAVSGRPYPEIQGRRAAAGAAPVTDRPGPHPADPLPPPASPRQALSPLRRPLAARARQARPAAR